jgi:AcrR family transcriptional regulator
MTSATLPASKRDQLLDVAWRLFYRDGYHRVGIDLILEESGIAKKTLYNHFASKDELIVSLLDRQNAAIMQTLDARIASAGARPATRFMAVFGWLSDWIRGADFRGCAFSRAIAEFPEASAPVHQAAWRFKVAIRERLLAIAREIDTRRSAALADAAALLIEGAIMTAHGSGEPDAANVAQASARQLLRALEASN